MNRPTQKTGRFRSFRLILCAEIAALTVIACVTVIPIAVGTTIFGDTGREAADLYYILSCLVILMAQLLYLTPFRNLQILDWRAVGFSAMILAAALWFWIAGGDGGLLRFSAIEEGRILGPSLWALTFPLVHALANLFSMGTKPRNPIEGAVPR